MAVTAKNLPYPVAADGRPHIDQAIAALGVKIDDILLSLTETERLALAGADLWDGKLVIQSTTGAGPKGLYEQKTSTWRSMIPIGPRIAYTPALTATTTNPTLGSTGSTDGWYMEMGELCIGRATATFAGTGAAIGTGQYRFSLPLAYSGAGTPVIGTWMASHNGSPPINYTADGGAAGLQIVTSTTVKMLFNDSVGEFGAATLNWGIGSPVGANVWCEFAYLR